VDEGVELEESWKASATAGYLAKKKKFIINVTKATHLWRTPYRACKSTASTWIIAKPPPEVLERSCWRCQSHWQGHWRQYLVSKPVAG